jgi:hypothetical protein
MRTPVGGYLRNHAVFVHTTAVVLPHRGDLFNVQSLYFCLDLGKATVGISSNIPILSFHFIICTLTFQ